MFSLTKLLTLAILVLAVWFAFKWVARVNQIGRERAQENRRAAGEKRRALQAEDMVRCAACGVYVSPASATACGRPGCPYA
jgi:uncharacterized protein HemY